MVKVSVIIPVYNLELYLETCLNSIVSQSLADLEIICVDDGSTDNSADIISNYCKKDERIKAVFCKKNNGQAYARNLGLNLAKGEYIYFVDGDDLLKECSLKYLYDVASKEKLDAVTFNTDVIYDNEDLRKLYPYRGKRKNCYLGIMNGKDFFIKSQENYDWVPTVWRYLWNRKFLMEHGLYFYAAAAPHEDGLFLFCTMWKIRRIRCLDKSFYVYRRRNGSIMTGGMTMRRIKGRFVSFVEQLYFLRSQQEDMEDTFRKKLDRYFQNTIHDIRLYIKKYIWAGYNPSSIVFDDIFHEILYNVFLNDRFQLLSSSFKSYAREQLLKREVIVYGDGDVGRQTRDWLAVMGVDDPWIAISMVGDAGKYHSKKVYQIEELKCIKDTSIVLIASSGKNREEMEEKLREIGFHNYFFMT